MFFAFYLFRKRGYSFGRCHLGVTAKIHARQTHALRTVMLAAMQVACSYLPSQQ